MFNFIKIYMEYKKIQKQVTSIYKNVTKMGKYVEELNKDVATLKKHSHKPIFTKDQYKSLDERIAVIEGFIDNVEKISTEYMKDIAN